MPRERRKQHLICTSLLYGDEKVEVLQVLEKDLDKDINKIEKEIKKEEKLKIKKDRIFKKPNPEELQVNGHALKVGYPDPDPEEEDMEELQHEIVDVIDEDPVVQVQEDFAETPDVYLRAIESLSESIRQLNEKLDKSERKRREDQETVMDVLDDLSTQLAGLNESSAKGENKPSGRRNAQMFQFPIDTIERLTTIEEEMRTDKKLRQELVKTFEEGGSNKLKSLKNWISDEIIIKFNKKGRPSSSAEGNLKFKESLFFQIIGSAWLSDDFTKDDYQEVLRLHRTRASNRLDKYKASKTKRRSSDDNED